MLQLVDLCKEYRTGSLVQKALDHVSLNLRENEFVAILGPSGSGKSTLLNIVGGLDHYDSGDLIINGISTKKYKDRDWDSYRNHTIGFIFQSYNLIPHQSVLANVELALTISGISRRERTERAKDALRKVGLGEQMHKKPSQMSGGQMQRVAIARALVNDPDILLADEPTGALDTETSIQVMDLLKEVARDRLVVMVTHNPDLAYEYANRIVRLKDGKIISDTNPYTPEEEAVEQPHHETMGKSSMSFLTALSLSFNNLMTKKARTVLVAFAGSIGIIGIALILSLSNGVNTFIKNTEEDTLSEYPIEIQKSAFSLVSMMGGDSDSGPSVVKTDDKGGATEQDVIARMSSRVTKNDLTSFRKWLEEGTSGIEPYARSVEYHYAVTPQIFKENDGEVIQVNPNKVLNSSGLIPTSSLYSSTFSTSVFSALPKDNDLYRNSYEVKAGRWPEKYNEAVVVLSSEGNISDMTLYTLGLKDYDTFETLVDSIKDSENTEKTGSTGSAADDSGKVYPYVELTGAEFRLVPNSSLYSYDDSVGVWTDRSSDKDYVKSLVDQAETIKVVGVVKPTADTDVTMLTMGIAYSADLTGHVMEENKDSAIVRAQLADSSKDVLTGKEFGTDNKDFDLKSLFSVDGDAMKKAFSFDTTKLKFDASGLNLNMDSMNLDSLGKDISLPQMDMSNMQGFDADTLTDAMKGIKLDTSKLDMQKIFSDLAKDFLDKTTLDNGVVAYVQSDEARTSFKDSLQKLAAESFDREELCSYTKQMNQELMDAFVSHLKDTGCDWPKSAEECQAKMQEWRDCDECKAIIDKYNEKIKESLTPTEDQQKELLTSLADGYRSYAEENGYSASLTQDFQEYLAGGSGMKILTSEVGKMIDMDEVTREISTSISQAVGDSLKSSMETYMKTVMGQISSAITSSLASQIQKAMTGMAEELPKAISFNTDAFANAIHMNMTAEEMQQMMASMMSETSSYESNLTNFGYADEEDPSEIVIYPHDFEAKTEIEKILDNYNDKMKITGQDEKVISYTDIVGTMMTSVTKIVNTISWVLIAFVAISLVVSSIMIGVITHISVLERRKEIGILRAIGASKHNIREVFNAETFITGLLAGGIGVGTSLLLLLPTNYLVRRISGRQEISASLPPTAAVALVTLSVVLTLLSGLFPAQKAAKSDPVTALRTE
ncbi:MAG: ABC transporter ATP-binding protein/permease [Lachnospiraceae bacterium]|nr:ABC transporter ATP-binding protein/permease [Lachnospiraceae bacterium]